MSARREVFEIENKKAAQVCEAGPRQDRKRHRENAGRVKCSPDSFVVLHLESELAVTEPESQLEKKATRQCIRQMRVSHGDLGAVSFPACANSSRTKKAARDDRPDAMDWLAAAMEKRAVEIQSTAEVNRFERGIEPNVVLV